MIRLLITSVLWAFSFGIVKRYLADLDASFISLVRLALAFLIFLPFLRPKGLKPGQVLRLGAIGAIQYGLMYLAYLSAFRYLKAYQVAFFTIFTPLYVTLFNDLLDRRLRPRFLVAAALAVIGTGIITYREFALSDLQTGFWLMQLSNLCFAIGQIWYKRIPSEGKNDRDLFGLLYFGAVLLLLLPAGWVARSSMPVLNLTNVSALLYLGVIASGLGFFLWNVGAKEVNAGILAVMNNLKVPLAVLVSILVFRESADPVRLTAGLAFVLVALILNEKKAPVLHR